jgi:hypothetical protein
VVLKLLIPNQRVRHRIRKSLSQYACVMDQCPLPTLTMVVRRYVALHPATGICLDLFRDLEHFTTAMIERTCLDDGCRGLGLTIEPPEGADVRYTWGKDRSSLADPRTQAVYLYNEPHCNDIGRRLSLIAQG